MLIKDILTEKDIQSNFDEFINDVINNKPRIIKKNEDFVVIVSIKQMKELLSKYEISYTYEMDEDGKFVRYINQIDDIVAKGNTLEELINNLSYNLYYYAKDYYNNFNRCSISNNLKSHVNYIFRILLEDNIESISKMLIKQCS
jgi:hypothetical protein